MPTSFVIRSTRSLPFCFNWRAAIILFPVAETAVTLHRGAASVSETNVSSDVSITVYTLYINMCSNKNNKNSNYFEQGKLL